MDISLSEIRAFNATVKNGNYTKAASDLGVSQPAITVQIRKIESRFNGALFERINNGVRLTNLGQELHRVTRQYPDLEASIQALAEPERQTQQTIHVATASPLIFMPLFANFYQRFPESQLHIVSGTTTECRKMLLDREVDIGLFPCPLEENSISKLAYHSHHLMAILPLDHPLGNQKQLSVHQLINYPLIFSKTDAYTQKVVDHAFKEAGLTPFPHIHMDSRYDTCEAVIYGLGIGFSLANDIRPDSRYLMVPIQEAQEEIVEHVVWLKARSGLPSIRNFVQLALENRCAETGKPIP